MKRVLVFLLVALSLFSVIYIVGNSFINTEVEVVEPVEVAPNKIGVYRLIKDVNKATVLSPQQYEYVELLESELEGVQYDRSEKLKIKSGTIFKYEVKTGSLITNKMLVNPDERDYIYLAIKDDELPYFYEATGIGVVELFGLQAGDRVSFISTSTSANMNSDYQNESVLVSKVIVRDARVLSVIESDKENAIGGEPAKHGLILSIKTKDALKLEMAQKIGTVNIIPDAFENRHLSIRSSDIIEDQFSVRELRGN